MGMTREALLDFVDRMKELERVKQRRLAEPHEETPAERLRQGDALRDHIQSIHPDWPTEEQRREDFLTHVRVSEMLRSVKPKNRR